MQWDLPRKGVGPISDNARIGAERPPPDDHVGVVIQGTMRYEVGRHPLPTDLGPQGLGLGPVDAGLD
jgi:hypothetical protein